MLQTSEGSSSGDSALRRVPSVKDFAEGRVCKACDVHFPKVSPSASGARLSRSHSSRFSTKNWVAAPRSAQGFAHEGRESDASDSFCCVSRLVGKIVGAKKLTEKCPTYVVVKGIRMNGSLVDVAVTSTCPLTTDEPLWENAFSYKCSAGWGAAQLAGLRFLVYGCQRWQEEPTSFGTDNLFAGADLDLSNFRPGTVSQETLSLMAPANQLKGKKAIKRARQECGRLFVELTVFTALHPKPLPIDTMLLEKISKAQRITALEICLKKLCNPPLHAVRPLCCRVRAVMLNGRRRELCTVDARMEDGQAYWDEEIRVEMDKLQDEEREPQLLVFDVFSADGGHVGSAWLGLSLLFPFAGELCPITLRLLRESQLLESRLTKEGKLSGGSSSAAGVLQGTFDYGFKSSDGLLSWFRRPHLKRSFLRPTSGQPALVVEVSVEVVEEPEPFFELLGEPIRVRDAEDVSYIMKRFPWQETLYELPQELRAVYARQTLNQYVLNGEGRIVFIWGMLFGASGLPAADLLGKSDPYCIVEGTSEAGEQIFIHRTRAIKNSSNPEWNETFYFQATDGIAVDKLLLSIYDEDEDILGIEMKDDFLCKLSIPLRNLPSGERVCENFAVSHMRGSGGALERVSQGGGFRHPCTVSAAVHVERRVQPVLTKEVSEPPPVGRGYELSRPTPFYLDPSQLTGPHTQKSRSEQDTASKVLERRETGGLLQLARQNQSSLIDDPWMQPLGSRSPTERTSPKSVATADGLLDVPSASQAPSPKGFSRSAFIDGKDNVKVGVQAAGDVVSVPSPEISVALARSVSLPAIHTLVGPTSAFSAEWQGPRLARLATPTNRTVQGPAQSRRQRKILREPTDQEKEATMLPAMSSPKGFRRGDTWSRGRSTSFQAALYRKRAATPSLV